MARPWPLVGRTREQQLAEAAFAESSCAGVVLTGDAGMGKTRLARDFFDQCQASGRDTLWVSATSSVRSVPFGAFAHLLPTTLLASGGVTNLLRAAAQALPGIARGRVPLVCVDDAHLLDHLAAALVHHLAVARSARLLLTVRSRARVPGSIEALWKDHFVERVALAPLSESDVHDLVSTALDGVVDRRVYHNVWCMSQGNPLLVHELLVGGVETGVIAQRAGVWRWDGAAIAVPGLREFVQTRMGRLTPEARRVMASVAFAEPLEPSIVETLADTALLEALGRRDLVRFERDGRRKFLRLAHPLYGEVIRASPQWSQRALDDLLRRLQALPKRRRGDLLRLATLHLEAGSHASVALMLEAGREAIRRFDYGLAERFATAIPRDGAPSGSVTLLLSEALIGQDRIADANRLLANTNLRHQTDLQLARFTIARAHLLFWRLRRGDDAASVIAAAERAVTDPVARDELTAERVALLLFGGKTEAAIETARPVFERGRSSDRGLMLTGAGLAQGLALLGRHNAARAVIDRTRTATQRASRSPNFPFAVQWLDLVAGQVDLCEGSICAAIARHRSVHDELVEVVGESPRGAALFFLGVAYRVQGRLHTAIDCLQQGIALLREKDGFNHLGACLAELSHCLALAGDITGAELLLAEGEERRTDCFRFDQFYFGQARTWLADGRGDPAAALACARENADRLLAMKHQVHGAIALFDVARLGRPGDVQSALASLADQVEGPLVRSLAEGAAALAARDGRRLDEVAAAFEELGALLFAAEMAIAGGRLHREAGRAAAAGAAAERVRRLAVTCEGVRHLTVSWQSVCDALTPRERQIAVLAGRGRSSKQIAADLRVSVRTVDNHLHVAYSKLGVRNRLELGSLFSDWPEAHDRREQASGSPVHGLVIAAEKRQSGWRAFGSYPNDMTNTRGRLADDRKSGAAVRSSGKRPY